ncbi:MAM domain-containing glycosylphosphatidylinositol anchor protein 1 isoform X2 [Lepisosteus oculatus]|uniref:MAM domain-containing glycosylphosphatidylinositol anchor protein 1 isoform X2 n=1 Tax=Lepisosteus oculatus TaxID=7918 RepID=UPI0035F52F84
MDLVWILFLSVLYPYAAGQGVYAPANAQIVHSGQACVVKDDNMSERIYTIREGDMLVLQCLVKGHPRPQVRWTKTAGSASDKFQETSIFNETLRIERIQRVQGGRYYCKAENGVGVPAIKSIRVDVQYLDKPILTVHQTISDVRGSYYQEKTVFLRCTVNSNPPARFIWRRNYVSIEQSKDNGVDIYEPLYTQGETKVLKLKNLRPQDFANYTCQVSVRNVCDIPDSEVTFQLTSATSPPSLRLSVNETLVVDPGTDVTMSCDVTGGEPVPTVLWSRFPAPLPPWAQARGSTLSLRRVTPRDAGFYSCTAVNNVGNPAKRTVNLIVRVLRNITFQITPDSNKDSETIQMGRDLKLSCHVDAQPQDKVSYSWYKNSAPVQPSESLILLRSDPDMAPGTSSLEIIDMKFRDQATYSCVARFPGSSVPELRVDVNITQSSVTPPVLTVPPGGSMVTVSEGKGAELVCLVDGKPRPPVLWSRADKDLPMPSGENLVETKEGRLRLDNVTRNMSGSYRCQTAQYNGLNIKRREALVQLNVQFPPIVDPVFQDVRSKLFQRLPLRCSVLKANPARIEQATWLLNGRRLPGGVVLPEASEYVIGTLSTGNNGTYECRISNSAGSTSCVFSVSARAYSPEFYYDTPTPIYTLRTSRNYTYDLQWTQREPNAVDKIIGYWISVTQIQKRQTVLSKQITVKEPQKGSLLSYKIQDLRIPLSYEVRLTPITTYGLGDSATRNIQYSEAFNYPGPLAERVCGFEDDRMCGFTQDQNDKFDWIRQNNLTQNPKRSANTGPIKDRSNTDEGYYMYIEASSPRVQGDNARLISPIYNVTVSKGAVRSRTPYCISFYYHMHGKHIGSLNVMLRGRSFGGTGPPVWSLSGSQGNSWKQANVTVSPSGPFQVVFEGVRGSGFEGDIAIDDVSVTKGRCKQDNPISNTVLPGRASELLPLPLGALLACSLFSALLLSR